MPYILNRQTLLKPRTIVLVPPGGMKIVNKDVFNMEGIYFYLHEWFVENKWARTEEYFWPEILYLQREGAAGTELWIKWRFKKPGKESAFDWLIDMDWHVLGMKDVDVVAKGKKLKVQTAEVEIVFHPRVVDKEEFFKEPFYAKVRKFLQKRVIKAKVDREEDELYDEATKLHDAIKGYFRLDTYLSEPSFERFYPTRTGEEPKGPI